MSSSNTTVRRSAFHPDEEVNTEHLCLKVIRKAISERRFTFYFIERDETSEFNSSDKKCWTKSIMLYVLGYVTWIYLEYDELFWVSNSGPTLLDPLEFIATRCKNGKLIASNDYRLSDHSVFNDEISSFRTFLLFDLHDNSSPFESLSRIFRHILGSARSRILIQSYWFNFFKAMSKGLYKYRID